VSRKFWIPAALFIAFFGVAVPALVIDDNQKDTGGGGGGGGGGGAAATAVGGKAAAGGKAAGGAATASAQGKELFTQNCGTCHVLNDAGTSGKVGPPLDSLKPDEKRVIAAIEKGGLGSGTMPAGIITGKDAQAVAQYVSSVAGQ
jgi:mono/diheme cytochrome c family protein